MSDAHIDMDMISFGMWKISNDDAPQVVQGALAHGYRCIDTAAAYGNEYGVGIGIAQSGISRSLISVSTKLWNSDRTYDLALKACELSLKELKLDYLDSYLIHWPASPAVHSDWERINSDTWKAFEQLFEEGLVKHIGVCNFKINHLEALSCKANIAPMINQIEIHPGQPQVDIVNYCKARNINIQASSALGSGKLLRKERIKCIAERYKKTPAQLCIKWCLQRGIVPIVKTTSASRMTENINVFDFSITEEDMQQITSLPYMGGSGLDSDTVTIFG